MANWNSTSYPRTIKFKCGYCDQNVASKDGFEHIIGGRASFEFLRICPLCNKPTYINEYESYIQIPGNVYGDTIKFLPENISSLYDEARKCFSINGYTSVIMCCRKLLMHIACQEGAGENLSFGKYVQFLKGNGYVTKPGQAWAESILKMGNIANHTLECYSKDEAELVMRFTEMMLKTIYETPGFHDELVAEK